MKKTTVKGSRNKHLFRAIGEQFKALGYKVYRNTSPESGCHGELYGPDGDEGLVQWTGIRGTPTHTLEEFFALTPEDVQDYVPKKHKVTARSIKEANGWDQRDEIVLED